MPPGVIWLNKAEVTDSANGDEQVDIVAVHGLGGDSIEAWTDSTTGVNWLRDLLPKHVKAARVLTYGYDASPTLFLTNRASTTIQRSAECLVQELYADRKLSDMLKRPIIFKSLVYSSTRTAAKVGHLWDQFVSTFAILFLGTPHDSTKRSSWQALEKLPNASWQSKVLSGDRLSRSTSEDNIPFQSITAEFNPIMKQFHMFFFWEELRTVVGDRYDYIVDPSSAVIDIDNTEKAGIHATHFQMTKFNTETMSGFRTMAEAILRYRQDAPRIISNRWSQAIPSLQKIQSNEDYGLGGLAFDLHTKGSFFLNRIGAQQVTPSHFYPPQRKTFIIFGMGGSGKTQLCSKFAEDHQADYSGVFTIHAASHETIRDSFCKIAKIGGLEGTESAGRHYLSQLDGTWLLIVDNADDPSLDLQDLFSPGIRAHILVTTRNPDFRQAGSLGSLELKGLQENEAVQLLFIKADIQRPWDLPTIDAGKTIAKTLGYLALALIHAGNCIYRRICELGDYLNLHSSSRSMLQRRKSSASKEAVAEADMVRAVYSTFDVSLDLLLRENNRKAQDASDLLKIIAFYHFEHIPMEIFIRAVLNRAKTTKPAADESFNTRLLRAITDRLEPPKILPDFLKGDHDQLDKYRITKAIGELQSLSLINYDERDRTYSMHPLVHAWARDSLSTSERKVWASIAFTILMESILLPPESNPEEDGDFYRDILPHVDSSLQEHELPMSLALGDTRLQIAKIFQPTLLLICGYILATCGRFGEAAGRLQMVKDSLLRLLGHEHEKSLAAMLGLAGVLWGLGRLEEAIDLQRQVVDTRKRLYGLDHEHTLQAMDHLGKSYWLHGQYKEALDIQEVAVQLAKAKLGKTHALTLGALDNLGVTLGSWHRFKESAEAHREVLAARQESLGDTHLDTLTTKSNLAMAILDLGETDEASVLMSTVHKQRQQQLGKEHPWTLWALCYLAKIYVKLGRLNEAEAMLVWGVEAGERSLSKTQLGVLMGRGRIAEAEKLLVETVESIETSRGLAHPDGVFVRLKLADLYVNCRLGLQKADLRITRDHPLGQRLEALLISLQDTVT
ncbi:hypothetical protein F4808DRAFT_467764 [Astrocystis sublimbata]|nr:hypothetical protein F4808DRAFT_467764 [Astrocystis sublimbata]